MCGVAGCVEDVATGAAWERTTALVGRLVHRGPDGRGVTATRRVAIGATRLAIRGPESLPAPLVDEAAGLALAYNGELYDLPSSASDTRWLLGELGRRRRALRLDGMYAYAAADLRAERVRLRRDPLGIKPLYLARAGAGTAFCSELPPLADVLGLSPVLGRTALLEYVGLGCRLGDETAFPGVRSLPRGREVVLEPGRRPRTRPARATGVERGDGGRDPELLLRVIVEAIRRCMPGNGPVGLFLSGGVDSRTLAAGLAADGREDVHTFSLLLGDDGVPDLRTLALPGTAWRAWRHTPIVVDRRSFWAAYRGVLEATSEPVFPPSTAYTWILARAAAAAGLRVALSGEGVDELFGGYASYASFPEDGDPASFYLGNPVFRWASTLVAGDAVTAAARRVAARGAGDGTPYRRLLDAERSISLPPLLQRLDAIGMRHSLEVRTPFLHAGVPALASGEPFPPRGSKPRFRAAAALLIGERAAGARKRPLRAPLGRLLGDAERVALRRCLLSEDVPRLLPVEPEVLPRAAASLSTRDEAVLLVALRLAQVVHYLRRFGATS